MILCCFGFVGCLFILVMTAYLIALLFFGLIIGGFVRILFIWFWCLVCLFDLCCLFDFVWVCLAFRWVCVLICCFWVVVLSMVFGWCAGVGWWVCVVLGLCFVDYLVLAYG